MVSAVIDAVSIYREEIIVRVRQRIQYYYYYDVVVVVTDIDKEEIMWYELKEVTLLAGLLLLHECVCVCIVLINWTCETIKPVIYHNRYSVINNKFTMHPEKFKTSFSSELESKDYNGRSLRLKKNIKT